MCFPTLLMQTNDSLTSKVMDDSLKLCTGKSGLLSFVLPKLKKRITVSSHTPLHWKKHPMAGTFLQSGESDLIHIYKGFIFIRMSFSAQTVSVQDFCLFLQSLVGHLVT